MAPAEAARWLLRRADSYGRDAETLAHNGDADDALIYRAIRDELRKCAAEVAETA